MATMTNEAEASGAAAPSFLRLPKDLCLKCMLSFDWNSLAVASCVSREMRALATYITQQPYWVTKVEDEPAILVADFSSPDDQHQACERWVSSFLEPIEGKGPPDLCLFFVSPKMSPNLLPLLTELRSKLPGCCTLTGMVALGVIGVDSKKEEAEEIESEERQALSACLIRFPQGSKVKVAHMQGAMGAGELPAIGGPGRRLTWWVLGGDPAEQIESTIERLAQQYPGSKFIGGMAGGTEPGPALFVGLPRRWPRQPLKVDVTTGTLCISLESPLLFGEVVSSRGLYCFSTCHVITRVDKDVEVEGRGRITMVQQLSHFMELRSTVAPRPWVRVGPPFTPTSALVSALRHQQHQNQQLNARAPLFLGVRAHSLPGRNDVFYNDPMQMHQLNDPTNIMRSSGSMPLSRPVEEGEMAAFFMPDAELAASQLEERVNLAFEELWPADPPDTPLNLNGQPLPPELVLQLAPHSLMGALSFVCKGRGQKLYGEDKPGLESMLVLEAFPGIALCGCFCASQIGPVPDDERGFPDGLPAHVMGFTTVMGFLKMLPVCPDVGESSEGHVDE